MIALERFSYGNWKFIDLISLCVMVMFVYCNVCKFFADITKRHNHVTTYTAWNELMLRQMVAYYLHYEKIPLYLHMFLSLIDRLISFVFPLIDTPYTYLKLLDKLHQKWQASAHTVHIISISVGRCIKIVIARITR